MNRFMGYFVEIQMHKAVLIFEHTWYGYDGDSSREDTVVLSHNSKEVLNHLIEKECRNRLTTQYGDFGLMTHQCVLKSTDTFETK